MKTKYGFRQRKEYLDMCDRIGNRWVEVFEGDAELYSSAYWDLLTEMWRRQAPVRKTDAARFMKAVKSPHTAARYIETAVAKGLVIETANPDDARSKLVMLAPDTRRHLDSFFDAAVREMKSSLERIEGGSDVRS